MQRYTGSFQTSAPVLSTFDTDTGTMAWLNPSALVQGKVYKFAGYGLNPTGPLSSISP